MMMMRVAVTVTKILSPVVVRANNKSLTRRLATFRSRFRESSVSTATATLSPSSFSKNPCLDLYFELAREPQSGHHHPYRYLDPLLSLSWSHDSLTTLKLICNLAIPHDDGIKDRDSLDRDPLDRDSFHTALLWLHQNHPKTLACNVEAIVGREHSELSIGNLKDFVIIMYRLLLPEGGNRNDILYNSVIDVAIHKKGILGRYERDPNYQFLHDRVTDVFAANFRSDFEKLKKQKPNEKMYSNEFSKASAPDVLGCEARYGDFIFSSAGIRNSVVVATVFLCESIARKVFPCELDVEKNEVDYTHRVLNRLSKEVLEPVWNMNHKEVLEPEWYMNHGPHFQVCKVRQYLEGVKAGKSKIAADALLPHEILSYVNDSGGNDYYVSDSNVNESYVVEQPLGDVAELQWKAMTEDFSNRGKWKNCLAVFDVWRILGSMVQYEVSVAMGLLVSQLSDKEPWKGQVIPFTQSPNRLHLIQGDDLKSKLAFLRRDFLRCFGHRGNSTTTQKVLDLILQEAVNANLKPEQMIKKVLVFAGVDSNISSIQADHWPITYQVMRSKFEERGYAMPHIVFWNFCEHKKIVSSQLPGMTTFSGYSDDFLKLFLDREGDVSPDHAMEAAICGKEYQNLYDNTGTVTLAKGLQDKTRVNLYRNYITLLKKAADDGADAVGYIVAARQLRM